MRSNYQFFISFCTIFGALPLLLTLTLPCYGEEETLFNGKDLEGWQGSSKIWSVEDGVIVGKKIGNPPANSYLIYQGKPVRDFRLTFKARVIGKNSTGVIYRGQIVDDQEQPFRVLGYIAMVDPVAAYAGALHADGTGRGIVAIYGEKVVSTKEGERKVVGKLSEVIPIDSAEWHTYVVEVRGNHLVHKVDDVVSIDVVDEHETQFKEGVLGLQARIGRDATMYFKDLVLERF